jgi:hypothetical protein
VAAGLGFEIPVARWSAWPHGCSEAVQAPDVQFVDPALRRRLGPLARMMLHVARACAQDIPHLRLVFASQHGELGYTIALLRSLSAAEPLSPTLFSLSVHNSAPGLFSTWRADRAESTALAAGEETLGHALLEAYCQLCADPARPVLMVYGDRPLPQEYREFAPESEDAHAHGHAVAVLLSSEALRRASVSAHAAADAAPSGETQAESFIGYLQEGRPARWIGRAKTWSWH